MHKLKALFYDLDVLYNFVFSMQLTYLTKMRLQVRILMKYFTIEAFTQKSNFSLKFDKNLASPVRFIMQKIVMSLFQLGLHIN